MTILAEALRACAGGILTAEAGISLLIDCGGWLHRDDFTSQFIIAATSISDGTLMASIDWQAAVTALDDGRLPCSSGERHMLRLAASIAAGIPVRLCDALTGIDHGNADIVIRAVAHATGTGLPGNGTIAAGPAPRPGSTTLMITGAGRPGSPSRP